MFLWSLRMRQNFPLLALGATMVASLSGCGGDSGGGLAPPASLLSYAGTTGVFAAWADPDGSAFAAAAPGSYAGKKQSLRGVVDFLSGQNLGQPAGVEVYKGSDGHIYALDLTVYTNPSPQQISAEAAATVDATCSLSGNAVPGANTDYAGVMFAADLATPTNSSYLYRLPGPDGVCNTPDDVVHMVKTGMSASSAPIVVSAMPVASVHNSQGGLEGFVIKSGATLVMVDSNFANPIVLGTFAAPVSVAVALTVGTLQGYPTGQLYAVDGQIVYVNYAAHTTSAALFTIPNWSPLVQGATYAASPTTQYFSVNLPASASAAASATLYSMPADGSAAPTAIATAVGRITQLQFPVQSNYVIVGAASPLYSIKAIPAAGGAAITLVSSTAANGGDFTATAADVYYTTWTSVTDSAAKTVTRSGTESGIVDVAGGVVLAPVANSAFVSGGEQQPWPSDTVTTQTAYMTMFQIVGLSPVSATDPATGIQYIEDGVGGGSMMAIDATSNQVVATIGVLPTTSATALSGTFRGNGDTGFLEATSPLSTQDPATRDLYLLNSQTTNSLTQVTNNL
jgi:hypothetical protein